MIPDSFIQVLLFREAPEFWREFAPRARDDDPIIVVSANASADLKLVAISVATHLGRATGTGVRVHNIHPACTVYTMER